MRPYAALRGLGTWEVHCPPWARLLLKISIYKKLPVNKTQVERTNWVFLNFYSSPSGLTLNQRFVVKVLYTLLIKSVH